MEEKGITPEINEGRSHVKKWGGQACETQCPGLVYIRKKTALKKNLKGGTETK